MSDRPHSRQRVWQAAQRAAGNCERCGRPAVPGRTECPEHAAASRERAAARNAAGRERGRELAAARRAARKAAGLCVVCGRPRDPGSVSRCPEHLAAHREAKRRGTTGRPRGRPRKDQG